MSTPWTSKNKPNTKTTPVTNVDGQASTSTGKTVTAHNFISVQSAETTAATKPTHCNCGMQFDPDSIHADEAGAWCVDCHQLEATESQAQFGGLRSATHAHNDTCRALNIPANATDAEILDASRGLK